MRLSEGIVQAYKNKWSMANTFTVQFNFYSEGAGEIMQGFPREEINLNIVSIQTPEFSNSPIEVWVGNRWKTQNGRDNLYKFTITFKDMDQMKLYRAWHQLYNETKNQYFNNICFSVEVQKDPDWYYEGFNMPFMTFNQTVIESLSQLSFSNDNQNQIAEFTVGFKCVAPQITYSFDRKKSAGSNVTETIMNIEQGVVDNTLSAMVPDSVSGFLK